MWPGIWSNTVLGNPKGAPGTLMSVLGEPVQRPKGSSYGMQAFCQSSAEYISALLIEIIHASCSDCCNSICSWFCDAPSSLTTACKK